MTKFDNSVVNFYKGKSIVVTGGAGSVGKALVEKLVNDLPTSRIRVIDNNESELFDMEQQYAGNKRVDFMHVDICDEVELMRSFCGMDFCVHAAALKHVPSCEKSPFGAVKVNILGIQNVITAAQKAKLQKVLFTSSDKAVSPPNVMGASKLMGERLFTAANFMPTSFGAQTEFFSTRFGNVAASRGSVIPVFKNQISKGGPVTVTDKRMTRFIMSLDESVELLIESMVHANPGDIFITKMPVLRIVDLAEVMVEELAPVYGYSPKDIEIKITGSRPGEKLWEELSSDEESRRIMEGERYLCLPPSHSQFQRSENSECPLKLKKKQVVYNSDLEGKMSKQEIKELLKKIGIKGTSIENTKNKAKLVSV